MSFRLPNFVALKRRAIWFALVALLFQAVLPFAAAYALPSSLVGGEQSHLCLSSISHNVTPPNGEKDGSAKNVCPVCQALNFFASNDAPPPQTVLARLDPILLTMVLIPVARVQAQDFYVPSSPRAPPAFLI